MNIHKRYGHPLNEIIDFLYENSISLIIELKNNR